MAADASSSFSAASSPPLRTASATQWARWSSSSAERDRLEGLGHRGDLLEDVDAVAVLLDHALEAAHATTSY